MEDSITKHIPLPKTTDKVKFLEELFSTVHERLENLRSNVKHE